MSRPATLLRALNRRSAPLLLAGLAAVGAHNWRRWRRDRALAERLRAERAPAPALASTPTVSALVAAWDEADTIEDHIRSFLALGYPRIELVLCAGGADGTLEIARRYAGERVTVLEQAPGEGKQRALARCLERASGEIIYLTDADCLYVEEALLRLLAPLVNEGEHASSGTNRPLPAQLAASAFVRCQWAVWYYRGPAAPRHVAGMLGRNAAARRAAVLESGGLRAPAPIGTDRALAGMLGQAGYRIRHVGDSWALTRYEERPGPYLRQQSRWVRNLVLYGRRFGAPGELRHGLLTMLAAAGTLGSLAAAPLLPILALPGALLFGHAVCARARYLAFAAAATGQPWPIPWLQLPGFVLLDLLAWAGALAQLAIPSERHRW